jgi:hypothetical protein
VQGHELLLIVLLEMNSITKGDEEHRAGPLREMERALGARWC